MERGWRGAFSYLGPQATELNEWSTLNSVMTNLLGISAHVASQVRLVLFYFDNAVAPLTKSSPLQKSDSYPGRPRGTICCPTRLRQEEIHFKLQNKDPKHLSPVKCIIIPGIFELN